MNKNPDQLILPFAFPVETSGERTDRPELFRLLKLARARDPEAVRKLQDPPHNLRIWLRDE